MNLTIGPTSWASWDFAVQDGETHLADIDVSWWREKGTLSIGGVDHRVYREGVMSGDFLIERDGVILARATKPSMFRNMFLLDYQGRQYTLRKQSVWKRTFVLLAGEDVVGDLTPNSMWTRKATVVLPDEWPLPLKVFVVWLAIILWKREADAAAAA